MSWLDELLSGPQGNPGPPGPIGPGGTGAPIFDVKSYGAKGDGFTDDILACQAAINAATASGGGTVFFPHGTYVISNYLSVTSPMDIVGDGNAIVQMGAAATAPAAMEISAANFSIRNLVFDINKAERFSLNVPLGGISLLNCTDFYLLGVTVMNASGSVAVDTVSFAVHGTCLRGKLLGCTALNAGYSSPAIINCDGFYVSGTEIVVDGCIADTCNDTGFVFENCNYCTGSNLISINCGDGFGVSAYGSSGAIYGHNSFNRMTVVSTRDDSCGFLIGLTGTVALGTTNAYLQDVQISNVVIDVPNNNDPAIYFFPQSDAGYVGRISNVRISGFTVVNTNSYGVYVSAADNVSLTDGYISSPYTCVGVTADCGNIVVDNVQCHNTAGVFGMSFGGNAGVAVRNCSIAGPNVQWAAYFYATNTGVSWRGNDVSGCGALIDQGGVGSDAGTMPRTLLLDFPIYRTAAPTLASTGQWPLGGLIYAKPTSNGLPSSSAYAWLVTTPGLVGTAVFTPLYYETRTIGKGGTLSPNGSTVWLSGNTDGKLALDIDFTGVNSTGIGFGNYGNLGYIRATSTGQVEVAGELLVDVGINADSNFPGAFTSMVRARKSSASLSAIGVGMDPSSVPASVQVAAPTAGNHQLYLPPGTLPSALLEGAVSYGGNNSGVHVDIQTGAMLVREKFATGVATTASIAPGTINAGTVYESADIAVTNYLQTSDIVKTMPPSGLESGLVWCVVCGSSVGNARIRLANCTGSNISTSSRTWSFVVEHT